MNRTNTAYPSLREVIRPTTIIEAPRLSRRLGTQLFIASETFQHTGSFKFRAGYNVALNVAERRLITASSGNFGQALAYACDLLGKECLVVMPATSAKVKIEAVREYGGRVELVDVKIKSRAERVQELAGEYPDAYVASAYDDPLVIEGNASLGEEISSLNLQFDLIVAPVGGGGLTSGIITGVRRSNREIDVVGAEPLIANDAARSLKAGRIVRNESEPQTIADGARTLSIGEHNWEVLRGGLKGIVEVPEENIKEATRLLFSLANLKVEPTGALGVAAVLTDPDLFRGRSICCVASGGNIDPDIYRNII
jgi:threonine dehydratase